MKGLPKMDSSTYAANLAIQLRKGYLSYCVLKICGDTSQYTSDIVKRLEAADLVVVEGTIYPLLGRLQKDGLLEHTWQESEQGPPRKYYRTTKFGNEVLHKLANDIDSLAKTLRKL